MTYEAAKSDQNRSIEIKVPNQERNFIHKVLRLYLPKEERINVLLEGRKRARIRDTKTNDKKAESFDRV